MPSYVAFLRAINLGAKRKVPMADLRPALAEAGFTGVATYIQTGNLALTTPLRSVRRVEERLEDLLSARYGFEVPTMAFTTADLAAVYAELLALDPPPFAGPDLTGRFVSFFKDPPPEEPFAAYVSEVDQVVLRGRVAHLWTGGTVLDAPAFRVLSKPLAPGTNRTLKVVRTLVERWC